MGSLLLPSPRQSHRLGNGTVDGKLVIVMVGLPARGKSYIAKILVRYLSWSGYPTRAFNVGNYWRKLGYAGADKSFFEGNNAEGQRLWAQMIHHAQEDMYQWSREDGIPKVALLDATNTNKARRQMLLRRAKEEEHTTVVFVESIYDDPRVLAQNYKLKLTNDVYKHQVPGKALRDFEQRVKAYEAVYGSIEDGEDGGDIQHMKLYNVEQKNMHIRPRKVWLTRHAGRVIIPDDSSKGHDAEELTEAGRRYSMSLARYLQLQQESSKMEAAGQEILVLVETRKVDYDSLAHLQMVYPVARTPLLNDEVEESSRDMDCSEWQNMDDPRTQDKQNGEQMECSFPGAWGESYEDVIQRICPLIVELERQQTSLLVVCHEAVHRCLYAYFMGIEVPKLPSLDLPQHQLTELSPSPFGTGCRYISESEMMQNF